MILCNAFITIFHVQKYENTTLLPIESQSKVISGE